MQFLGSSKCFISVTCYYKAYMSLLDEELTFLSWVCAFLDLLPAQAPPSLSQHVIKAIWGLFLLGIRKLGRH